MRRRGDGGAVEVLVIHRPEYGDWTLPKGRADEGENDDACALREVEEETGVRCALERELGVVRYTDARGREKSVRYWAMRPEQGEARPGDGVDEVRWLPLEEASALLTHERDREILGSVRGG